ILTNVREDHQDILGGTREEIARGLLSTCPRRGVLLTAEADPPIVAILRGEAERRGTRLEVVDPTRVTQDELARFDHLAHADNVDTGLALADLLGLERAVALDAMTRAEADPGVARIAQSSVDGREVTFVNLFAANDRESVVAGAHPFLASAGHDVTTIALLNN